MAEWKLRSLGNQGPMVSPLGLGTVKIGRNVGVKYPDRFELPDDQAVVELLETARELGVNLLDTAPAYGNSMQRLGKLLPGKREEWVIVSKVGEYFEQGRSRYDFSRDASIFSVEQSLLALGTDYLDVVLVHSNGDDLSILENTGVVEALHRLKEQGKICAHGLSGKTVAGGLKAIQELDVVMVTCNLDYNEEREVLVEAERCGKGVLIKKAFSSGHIDANRRDDALRFIYTQPGVSSIITGTLNPNHLRQNVESVRDILAED